MITAIDDEDCMEIYRLFNEPEGIAYLKAAGLSATEIADLDLYGISGIGNILSAIKMAKFYEMEDDDVIFTVLTDSSAMYTSRLTEQKNQKGPFTSIDAAKVHAGALLHQGIDNVEELGYYERLRVHNLKYYTWVEQQGKTYAEINAQWYDRSYWKQLPAYADKIDEMIIAFNNEVGLL
jgi:hypothetical protein